MVNPAWAVATWPLVMATVTEFNRVLPDMCQAAMSICRDAGQLPKGETLWTCRIAGQQVGLAWGWTEVSPEVIAMTDPTNILSNLVLLRDDGSVLDESMRCVWLNSAIHQLAWQIWTLEGMSGLYAARSGSPGQQGLHTWAHKLAGE